MGCSRGDPRRRPPRLAVTALEPQKPFGDRQADRDQCEDGAAERDAGGGRASLRHQAVVENVARMERSVMRGGLGGPNEPRISLRSIRATIARYRKPALIFSSAAEPGHSSFSESVLSGAS